MEVRLENLTKAFKNANKNGPAEIFAVNHVNLTIEDGTLISLLGPSGCGKSTTLNLICGLLTASEGKIFFGNEDVTALPPEKRGIGLVFQNYALYPHMTVRDNIAFPLGNLKGAEKLSKEEAKKRVDEAARLVQILEYMDRKPRELSGGQQQRVAIARALVKLPKVLLLDEPLSNLDARLRLATREEIRRIQRKTGITTIFVTHDQEEAMSISDMIVVMKDGEIMQSGKPQEVYDNPANLFVAKFLGTPQINVFNGRIKNGNVILQEKTGQEAILYTSKSNPLKDMEVDIAIRPEGFIPDKSGVFCAALSRIEVMGRDTSVIFTHDSSKEPLIRAIIDSDKKAAIEGDRVCFNINPSKIFVFNRTTGERIYI